MSTEVKLQNVRFAFANGLFNASKFDPKSDQKPKFRLVALVEPGSDNDKRVREAIKAEATTLWAEKAGQTVKSITGNPQKFFYQPGDNKDYDGFKGMMAASLGNVTRPRVVDRDGKTPVVEADDRIYSGCYGNVVFDIVAMNKAGAGVYGYIKGAQFVKDGDAFGGGAPLSEDAFGDLGDTGEGSKASATVADDDFGV